MMTPGRPRILRRKREVDGGGDRTRSSAISAADQIQHEAGHLRGTGEASAVEPGGEDRQRQGLDAEIFAGTDVVERLEQRERDANGDGGPRQWQGDASRQLQRPRSQHAGWLRE